MISSKWHTFYFLPNTYFQNVYVSNWNTLINIWTQVCWSVWVWFWHGGTAQNTHIESSACCSYVDWDEQTEAIFWMCVCVFLSVTEACVCASVCVCICNWSYPPSCHEKLFSFQFLCVPVHNSHYLKHWEVICSFSRRQLHCRISNIHTHTKTKDSTIPFVHVTQSVFIFYDSCILSQFIKDKHSVWWLIILHLNSLILYLTQSPKPVNVSRLQQYSVCVCLYLWTCQRVCACVCVCYLEWGDDLIDRGKMILSVRLDL